MTPHLTEREYQIVELIAWGACRKDVPAYLAAQYGGKEISIRTVEKNLEHIFQKLSLKSETELAAWYFCEYQGVDRSKSPLKQVRRSIYAVVMLILLMPQILNMDPAVRSQRTEVPSARAARANTARTVRTARVSFGRKD